MKNVDLSPYWSQVRQLFVDQHFITILCGLIVVIMAVKFYRFLRGISPALVPIVMLLMLFILIIHWTQTRTEPVFLKPAIDWLVRYIPTPTYWR
jgi:hypothetical protein